MSNRKNHRYSASEVITVGRTYVWTNGTQVKVTSIWSDKHADLVSLVIVKADDEPELVGRPGDTPPNSFYWATDWAASNAI